MERVTGSSRLLRAMNSSATLGHLLDHGPLTRAALRALTGLSKPTTSDVLRQLTDAGLAVVVGHASGGPGPNAEIYAAAPDAGYAIAVSLCSDGEMTGVLSDLAGTVTAQRTVALGPTPPVPAVAALTAGLTAEAGLRPGAVRHVQLGVPGAYDPGADTIRYIGVPGWNAPGLVGALRRRLSAPLDVDNDVNLAAVAERRHGVAGDVESFALVWFGHGIGLAIDYGGRLIRGVRGGAGEIGFLPARAEPGRTHLQDLVGGAAVAALAERYGLEPGPDGTAAVARASRAAQAGGAAAAFLSALADRIAHGLAAVAAVLDPPLIVLTGHVARAGGTALAGRVATALRRGIPWDTRIEVSGVSGDAVLLGARDTGRQAVRDALVDALRQPAPRYADLDHSRSAARWPTTRNADRR